MSTGADYAGREFGVTAVLHKVPRPGQRSLWHCRCSLCGEEFDCADERIVNGAAAKYGCGCRRVGPKHRYGRPPSAPTPKIVVPFPKRGQSL